MLFVWPPFRELGITSSLRHVGPDFPTAFEATQHILACFLLANTKQAARVGVLVVALPPPQIFSICSTF